MLYLVCMTIIFTLLFAWMLCGVKWLFMQPKAYVLCFLKWSIFWLTCFIAGVCTIVLIANAG